MLIVLTSGQRGDALGAAGVWPIHTPHLDALAASGLALTTVSPSPARMPALVSALTGLHVRQHGVTDDADPIPVVAGWMGRLAEAGYHTVGVGRVGPVIEYLNEARLVGEVDLADPSHCEYLRYAESSGILERVEQQRAVRLRSGPFGMADGMDEPTDDVDGFILASAIACIEALPRDRRWVMLVSLTGPGNDLPAPRPYLDLVKRSGLKRRIVPPEQRDLDLYADFAFPRNLLQRIDLPTAVTIRQHYLARVCLLDAAVGMIGEALSTHGQADRTWTVLAGDRGHLLGERGLYGCTSFLGSSTYAPLWVVPPEDQAEHLTDDGETRAHDGLVSGVDLAPTICNIGGVDPPFGCFGESVLPALRGGNVGRDAALSESADRLMLETLQYKLVMDVKDAGPLVLFDLLNDPDERENLAPQASDVIDRLRGRLTDTLLPLRPVLELL